MKKKPKLSVPKATRRRTGSARAGTKPDHAAPVKRGKARPKLPGRAAAADPKLTIRRLRSELAKARLHIEALEAAADQDFLLDVPNRRGFERELNRSIAYVKRYRATAALLIVDVDRLKPINDSLGHAAGDHVLKAIVGQLAQNVRQSDMIGRLGGDEFGVLLWNLAEADALAKAAALEQTVDNTACEYRGRRIRLGVSIGVTLLGADDEAAKVLERADQAMYERKQARRGKSPANVRR
jgi:diguanylate cyclase (GGDEF)-like protein